MHLYTQNASPNGQRVSIFLKEKGIELPMTQIDLRAGENLSEEYRTRNPFGRVPVLELDTCDATVRHKLNGACRI